MGALEYVTPLADLHPEPIPGYKFWVFLQAFTLGFSKITNMESSIETEPFHEGGVNHKVHSLNKSITGEKVMVLERGVANRGLATKYLTNIFKVGNRIYGDIFIMVFGRDQYLGKMYLVNGCTVKKWSISELNALSSELLIERFEITYETIEDFPLSTEVIDAVQKSIKLGTKESISDMMRKSRTKLKDNKEKTTALSPEEYFNQEITANPEDVKNGLIFPEEYFKESGASGGAAKEDIYPEEYFLNKKNNAEEIRKSDSTTAVKLKRLASVKKK